MPFPSDTKYPAVATNAAWQKKKNVLDKGIKTRVGPALIDAEKKWNLIKFDDLNDKKSGKTVAQAQRNLDGANAAMQAVVAARTSLQAAARLAETQSNNSKLNSASRTALKAIVTALKAADKRLADMSDIPGLFQVDLNNARAAALASLTNLEVKVGNKIIATANTAKLAANKTYEVSGVAWRIDHRLALENLQKEVKVTAFDATGGKFEQKMKLAGVKGEDEMRLA